MNEPRVTSLGLIFKKNIHGQTSIPNKGLYSMSHEAELYNMPAWERCGNKRMTKWTELDSFVASKMGFSINYEREYPKKDIKHMYRYSSNIANQVIKKNKLDINENDILKDVNIINTDCNLINTTLKSVPKLEKIGGNLLLDADSDLKDLTSLKEIGGKLTVAARNKEEMNKFLNKIGFMSSDGNVLIPIKKGISFIMKTY